MAARHQRNGRGPDRRAPRLATLGAALSRLQSHPGDAAGKAAVVEPSLIITHEASRKNVALPGTCRRLEALELRHDRVEGLRPFPRRVAIDALPGAQEAHEVA